MAAINEANHLISHRKDVIQSFTSDPERIGSAMCEYIDNMSHNNSDTLGNEKSIYKDGSLGDSLFNNGEFSEDADVVRQREKNEEKKREEEQERQDGKQEQQDEKFNNML